jgi:dihydroorotate dehydrogenase (NAD+) catalytic subunit
MRLEQDLAPSRHGGLRLAHPVIVAAGGAGYGAELIEAVGEELPGAVVTRSVTREARRGAPPPRMGGWADGLLSAVGTPNPGLDAVLRRQGPRWASSDVPVIVSICGEIVDDIATLARTLEMHPDADGLELNLACADRTRGGEPIGLEAEASETATVAARAATDLPLIVKLTAVAPDIRVIARAVAAAGADVISASGSLPALALDGAREGPLLGSAYGALSGPAIKPVGLRVAYEIAQVVRVPVIGIGGVHTLDDVLDYLAAGASAVGLATAALADPALPGRLGRELGAWCEEQGLSDVRELVGRALPARRDRGSLRQGPFRR